MDTIPQRHHFMPLYFLLFLLCLLFPGCKTEPDATKPTPKLTPEESLEQIVHYLQRMIETPFFDQSLGMGNTAISTLIQSSTVSHELLEPNKDRETYMARIIIETSQSYASKKLDPAGDSNGTEEPKKKPDYGAGFGDVEQNPLLGSPDDPADLAELLPEGTSEAIENGNTKNPVIHRTEGSWKDIVELKYVKDQWVIASDIETDWLRNDIERALEMVRYKHIK